MVPLDSLIQGYWVSKKPYSGRNVGQLTFLALLHSSDQVVDKVLQVTQRIRDACCLVDLRERRIEDSDNVPKQICRGTLRGYNEYAQSK